MQNVNSHHDEPSKYWCPRCGTMKTDYAGAMENEIYLPSLVSRLRGLLRQGSELNLDIGECINKPEDR